MFANISNHPTSSWSADQIEAATRLGHGPPQDLAELVLSVDAHATTAEVEKIADSIVERILSEGALGAHVATEFTLTVALVDRLRARKLPVYVATTARESRESPGPDGATHRTTVFRFVAWRAYGAPPHD